MNTKLLIVATLLTAAVAMLGVYLNDQKKLNATAGPFIEKNIIGKPHIWRSIVDKSMIPIAERTDWFD